MFQMRGPSSYLRKKENKLASVAANVGREEEEKGHFSGRMK